jgi:hypothetical protein
VETAHAARGDTGVDRRTRLDAAGKVQSYEAIFILAVSHTNFNALGVTFQSRPASLLEFRSDGTTGTTALELPVPIPRIVRIVKYFTIFSAAAIFGLVALPALPLIRGDSLRFSIRLGGWHRSTSVTRIWTKPHADCAVHHDVLGGDDFWPCRLSRRSYRRH